MKNTHYHKKAIIKAIYQTINDSVSLPEDKVKEIIFPMSLWCKSFDELFELLTNFTKLQCKAL